MYTQDMHSQDTHINRAGSICPKTRRPLLCAGAPRKGAPVQTGLGCSQQPEFPSPRPKENASRLELQLTGLSPPSLPPLTSWASQAPVSPLALELLYPRFPQAPRKLRTASDPGVDVGSLPCVGVRGEFPFPGENCIFSPRGPRLSGKQKCVCKQISVLCSSLPAPSHVCLLLQCGDPL